MKKLNILILEDDGNRIDWFLNKFKAYNCLTIDDPKIAIQVLEKQEFDYIFLDHDLLPEHYDKDTSCNMTTGLCVAEWLGNNLDKSKDAVIIIHSMNWNGARRMQQAMAERNADWVSYPILQQNLRIG